LQAYRKNTDTNGGSRMPYVMGNVGGEKHGFDINWVNCGALMNQFFGNKRTMLFARREDIQYATEEGVPVKLFAAKVPLFAVVNILVLCLLTVLFAICLDISLITPAC
jgi:hypothetical protein